MAKVGIMILAAGAASRMGQPKQLMAYCGKPLVVHAVHAALDSGCRPVVVVSGAAGERVSEVVQDSGVNVVHNPIWNEGVGTSIHAGVRAMMEAGVDAVILTLADLPDLTGTIYDRIHGEYQRTGRPIVASEYAGTVGVPVLFHRSFFPQLLALPADKGCKSVILSHLDGAALLPCPEAEADIDTADDFVRLGGLGSGEVRDNFRSPL